MVKDGGVGKNSISPMNGDPSMLDYVHVRVPFYVEGRRASKAAEPLPTPRLEYPQGVRKTPIRCRQHLSSGPGRSLYLLFSPDITNTSIGSEVIFAASKTPHLLLCRIENLRYVLFNGRPAPALGTLLRPDCMLFVLFSLFRDPPVGESQP